MLSYVNHNTGKLISAETSAEIPVAGVCKTGWERISQEEYRRLINLSYSPPAWDYPAIRLYKKVRHNPENTLIRA